MITKETPVVFYGAGATALALFKLFSRKYKIVCFCDNDKRKQDGRFAGLPVYSFQKALKKYPDLRVYVSTNDDYKFDIMDVLLGGGFPKERIINYEPYKKYTSCRYLEGRMGVSGKAMVVCCSNFGRNLSPVVSYSGDPNKNIQNFIHMRDLNIHQDFQIIHRQIGEERTCIGCPELKERYWAVNRRIKEISFSLRHKCNFRCFYCIENEVDNSALAGDEHLDEVLATMKLMRKQGVIDPNAVVSVATTEIAIHPCRDKILQGLEGYICQFMTNASVYSERISEFLKKSGKLVCSVDAGTPETFQKVKGVNMFERVCDHLKRYAQAGEVEVKYIFLPGINDNETDVDGFIAACRSIHPMAIHISRNTYDYGKQMPEHTLQMIARMIRMANEAGIQVNVSPPIFLESEYSEIQRLTASVKADLKQKGDN